jgi:putative ABC transport system substrate-binding protein
VIVTFGAAASSAAKAATTMIPVVFGSGEDPIRLGLVTNLSRPGGNLTGVTQLSIEVGPKRLEILHELVPTAAVFAVLVNPTNPSGNITDLQEAARRIGVQLHALHASTDSHFPIAFSSLVQLRAGALMISPDAFFNSRSEQLAAMAVRHALPAIYQYREFAAAGGLASYGGSLTDVYRLVGVYAGRILKAEKPGDLPVQQSTKVELIVNLKTAKALGITIPPTVIARADDVIG